MIKKRKKNVENRNKTIIFANGKSANLTKMKPILKLFLRLLKIAVIIVVAFVVLVITAVWLVNKPSVQNKFLSYATEILQDKLQTKVEIDSIRIGFFSDDVRI